MNWRLAGRDVRVGCWGLYLWGGRTDVVVSGPRLLAEMMLFQGRCTLVGTPGLHETTTTATTIEVGRDDPPTRAELVRKHVAIGRFDADDPVKGQITAHGDGRVAITDPRCADLVLVTRGQGKILASGLDRRGRIVTLPGGGPIRLEE